MNLKTVSDRFLYFLREKGLTQTEFETITGFPQHNLSRFITGKVKSPKIELITALLSHFPELNLRWLLIGEGEMFTSNNEMNIQQLLEKLALLENENGNLKDELMKAKDRIIGLLSE